MSSDNRSVGWAPRATMSSQKPQNPDNPATPPAPSDLPTEKLDPPPFEMPELRDFVEVEPGAGLHPLPGRPRLMLHA